MFFRNYDLDVTIYDALFYIYNDEDAYNWEIFPDAQTYYVEYLESFRYEQWNPYLIDRGLPLLGYVYGPFFVYGLTFVSLIIDILYPALSFSQKVWLSVVSAPLIFDSITTVFIYAILLKKKENGKRNLINMLYSATAAIIFIFLPVVNFYNTTLYLNTYMFTTFAVISFYFLSRDKHKHSAIFFSIAILTKLNALFLAPLWFVYICRNNLRKGIEFVLVLIVSYLVFSLPWIILAPLGFFYLQLWPGTVDSPFSIDDFNILWTVTPFHTFLYWDQGSTSFFWIDAATFYHSLNNIFLPLLLFVAVSCLVVLLKGKEMKEKKSMFYAYNALFVIGSHMFLTRGIYKYYDPYLFPFVLVALASWGENLFTNPDILKNCFSNFRNKINKDKQNNNTKRVETFTQIKSSEIIYHVLAALLFVGLIVWIFFLNWWIIFEVKWIHSFQIFLLALTIIAVYDLIHFLYYTLIAVIYCGVVWVSMISWIWYLPGGAIGINTSFLLIVFGITLIIANKFHFDFTIFNFKKYGDLWNFVKYENQNFKAFTKQMLENNRCRKREKIERINAKKLS